MNEKEKKLNNTKRENCSICGKAECFHCVIFNDSELLYTRLSPNQKTQRDNQIFRSIDTNIIETAKDLNCECMEFNLIGDSLCSVCLVNPYDYTCTLCGYMFCKDCVNSDDSSRFKRNSLISYIPMSTSTNDFQESLKEELNSIIDENDKDHVHYIRHKDLASQKSQFLLNFKKAIKIIQTIDHMKYLESYDSDSCLKFRNIISKAIENIYRELEENKIQIRSSKVEILNCMCSNIEKKIQKFDLNLTFQKTSIITENPNQELNFNDLMEGFTKIKSLRKVIHMMRSTDNIQMVITPNKNQKGNFKILKLNDLENKDMMHIHRLNSKIESSLYSICSTGNCILELTSNYDLQKYQYSIVNHAPSEKKIWNINLSSYISNNINHITNKISNPDLNNTNTYIDIVVDKIIHHEDNVFILFLVYELNEPKKEIYKKATKSVYSILRSIIIPNNNSNNKKFYESQQYFKFDERIFYLEVLKKEDTIHYIVASKIHEVIILSFEHEKILFKFDCLSYLFKCIEVDHTFYLFNKFELFVFIMNKPGLNKISLDQEIKNAFVDGNHVFLLSKKNILYCSLIINNEFLLNAQEICDVVYCGFVRGNCFVLIRNDGSMDIAVYKTLQLL